MPLETEKRVLNCYILSNFLYSSKCGQSYTKRLEVTSDSTDKCWECHEIFKENRDYNETTIRKKKIKFMGDKERLSKFNTHRVYWIQEKQRETVINLSDMFEWMDSRTWITKTK